MENTIYETCPNCGKMAESEGINNGIGYVYTPMHCLFCGWSEHCSLWQTEHCSKDCTEYVHCTKNE